MGRDPPHLQAAKVITNELLLLPGVVPSTAYRVYTKHLT